MTRLTTKWSRFRDKGFTLVDLLVSVTILSVVMASIAVLLWGSVRAVQTGTANVEANEDQRAIFRVLERDLNVAFSARDFGEYYQFYGTPIGFCYIGTVRSYEYRDAAKPNLARVTYVLHRQAGVKPIVQPDNTVLYTYSLLRFVEPNQRDLDSFPINWDTVRGNIEFPGVDAEFRLIENLRSPMAPLRWEDSVVEDLLKAKKRQLWIRMLSGQTDVPDGWGMIGKNPLDYVVIENILLPAPPMLQDPDKNYVGVEFFGYGLANRDSSVSFKNFWNADFNIYGLRPFYAGITDQDPRNPIYQPSGADFWVGTPMNPRLPELVRVTVILRYKSPYPGAPDTMREFSKVIDVPSGYMRTPLPYE